MINSENQTIHFAMIGMKPFSPTFVKYFIKICRDFLKSNNKNNLSIKFVGTEWTANITQQTLKTTRKMRSLLRNFLKDESGYAIVKYINISLVDQDLFNQSSFTKTPTFKKLPHKIQNS